MRVNFTSQKSLDLAAKVFYFFFTVIPTANLHDDAVDELRNEELAE